MRQYIVFTESGFPEKNDKFPCRFQLKGKGDSIVYCINGGRFFCTAFLDLFQVRKNCAIKSSKKWKVTEQVQFVLHKWTFFSTFLAHCVQSFKKVLLYIL